MRKILVKSTSKTLSQKDLWDVVTALEKYPTWCKTCIKMIPTTLEVGAIYHDITTLLWVPLKIKHVVMKMEPHKEIHIFLPLPGGGKMWHKFMLQQKGKEVLLISEITFDLGNKLKNATVGYLLEKRWIELIEQGYPGLKVVKRIQ